MTVNVLFAADPDNWPVYRRALQNAFARAGIAADLRDDFQQPETVDYIIYDPKSALRDFTPYTNLKAVLSLWAGVESFQHNPTLNVPLARMVDSGLREGMSDWVLGHVLRHHLGMDKHIHGQDGVWRWKESPPLARDRTVGILGLGMLGLAVARNLSAIGFNVCGWSRAPKTVAGLDCHAGNEGLRRVLAQSEILVLLLPATTATENIVNDESLAALPRGAVILNPGRGTLIDDAALIAALDRGHIAHATLDVFRTEPLPATHAYWAHPQVTVTPHIAADTRPESAAGTIAENIRRGQADEPFLYLVDREHGY